VVFAGTVVWYQVVGGPNNWKTDGGKPKIEDIPGQTKLVQPVSKLSKVFLRPMKVDYIRATTVATSRERKNATILRQKRYFDVVAS
jgi:hypothetical protein